MNERRKTSGGDGTSSGSEGAGESLANLAKALVQAGGVSSLSTMSQKHSGYPFGSVVPYAIDSAGNPIFLMSQMATHTKNLRSHSQATLLVAENSGLPLSAARVSLIGDIAKVTDDSRQVVAEAYLAKHPESKQWMSFGDFDFYRMTIKDIYFIGGFGVMGWVKPEDYVAAQKS
ncbi:HugZ family pyridoxamine 5'-phosphate oxidase [Mariniblastus fucicola]|uniref:Pyridoxamine 5'-phosphate oxidase n=1 Tax=Mariniblastus fucicola TaxID=980251 RepID=A0A5B9P6X0_9BACT|nr:pyridoxamine 5'-phosphate oxidase family protein [Mariniblastus fucicola]QEG20925.1 Pyridoxamine 5'-phosphate oxidase [Mariniblastus fucicola]